MGESCLRTYQIYLALDRQVKGPRRELRGMRTDRSTTFDLRSSPVVPPDRARGFAVVFFGLFVVAILVVALSAVLAIRAAFWTTGTTAFFLVYFWVLLVCFAGLFWWLAVYVIPIATRVDVNAGGVEFRLSNGRSRYFHWQNRRFRLDLYDLTQDPVARTLPQKPERFVRSWTKIEAILPQDAFAEVLRSARERGMWVGPPPSTISRGLRPGISVTRVSRLPPRNQ
jgi:hypothetical protein